MAQCKSPAENLQIDAVRYSVFGVQPFLINNNGACLCMAMFVLLENE